MGTKENHKSKASLPNKLAGREKGLIRMTDIWECSHCKLEWQVMNLFNGQITEKVRAEKLSRLHSSATVITPASFLTDFLVHVIHKDLIQQLPSTI